MDTAQKPEAKEDEQIQMPRIMPYNMTTSQQPKLNETNAVFSPNNMTVNLNQMMLTGGSEFNPGLTHMDLSQKIQYPLKDSRLLETRGQNTNNQQQLGYQNSTTNTFDLDRRLRYYEDSISQRDRELRDLQEHLRIVEL